MSNFLLSQTAVTSPVLHRFAVCTLTNKSAYIEALNTLRDDAQLRLSICIVLKDRLTTVAARCYMVDSARKFDS